MARRAERPAIVSESIDLFIGRLLWGTAGVLVALLVLVSVYREVVGK